MPVLETIGGIVCSRSCETSWVVAYACGEEVGYAEIVTTSPAGLNLAAAPAATPGTLVIAARSFSTSALPPVLGAVRSTPCLAASLLALVVLGTCATTCSGPLKPWPKPSARSWYALYVVKLSGSLLASLEPSRSAVAGAAISSSRSVAASAIGHEWACTYRLQRSHILPWRASVACAPARLARRLGRTTRLPAIVSSAGSSVSDASITSSTPIEAEIATP